VSGQVANTGEDETTLTCHDCGDQIDCCEFCDGSDCVVALCYGCVHLTLGENVPQPHLHGG
jgi:hypothetical protein